jgi:hypothetical protein
VRSRAAFARRASAPAVSLAGVAAFVALTAIASAQGGGKPATGNPTPGTAQPDPPNLADRVTFVGCLQTVTRRADAPASADSNAPSNARFELTRAERVDRVPAGTGGSPATASVSSKTFRLEGIDSQFSPFVGAKVEVSGGINVKSPGAPTLIVEFIQKLAAKC